MRWIAVCGALAGGAVLFALLIEGGLRGCGLNPACLWSVLVWMMTAAPMP